MRRLIVWGLVIISVGAAFAFVRPVAAQVLAGEVSDRGPRFLLASAARLVPVDVRRTSVLQRRLALDLAGVTLKEALDQISARSGLRLAYSDHVVPFTRRVHLRAEAITVAAALTDVLLGAGVDVVFDSSGGASLVKQPEPARTGSIAGQVTDVRNGEGLAAAELIVEGAQLRAMSGPDGRYRIAEVSPGTYRVTARRIGYVRQTQSAVVVTDQETTVDFSLEQAPTRLDELVTTGTVVPTEVRALPTPVTVITAEDIALQQPRTVQELLRQQVPGAVGWDVASIPFQTAFSVRGSSTLTAQGSGQMKVFVDGIELASTTRAAVDPGSIERIEVVRGPQAAAIYGPDAIGGIIQIFTKRGDPALARPRVGLEAAVGLMQTPYDGVGAVPRQEYRGSVRGGGTDVSYNFGAAYMRLGDWLPRGEISAQSGPSLYGGLRYARGIIEAELFGRYYSQHQPGVSNPELASTGLVGFLKPSLQASEHQSQTVGARLSVSPIEWWQHTVTVGVDRYMSEILQQQPRLTTPDDTLLFVFNQSHAKRSIGYNTSVQGPVGSGLSGSLIAGFDHYSLPVTTVFTLGALTTTGSIETAPGQSPALSRTVTNNTGYFGQAQLGIRDALFLTVGLRAEQNSDFGDEIGSPMSPRFGISYARPVRGATFKVRGSWGRAIRAPFATFALGSVSGIFVTLANPELGPERQQGWDAGVDVVFGSRSSLSATYYDQTADDLIQSVDLEFTPERIISQYQNVGRVKNTGAEVEGTLYVGPVQFKGQYGYARSRVAQLAPSYAGDLQIGDQVQYTPRHTAGVSLSFSPGSRTTIGAGLTYVGSWEGTDFLAQFSCFGGTGPCRATPRDYTVAYPGFVKLNASVWQQLTPVLSGFLAVANLTNNDVHENSNFTPVQGRTTTVGLRLNY